MTKRIIQFDVIEYILHSSDLKELKEFRTLLDQEIKAWEKISKIKKN